MTGGSTAAEAPTKPLEILHFNDVYEVEERQREPIGGVARFIGEVKKYPDACLLFSGDSLAPSLMSTVTKGAHMVEFLNMMGIKAACMGNHDFDFGVEHLVENCVNKCNFPWLLSNAYDRETGERLAQGKDVVMIEHSGWKIGLMGLIEEEWLATLSTIERDEVDYHDFVTVAKRLTAQMRAEGADLIVALTHMRTPNDHRLAMEVPEIDLILGGHDHDVYYEVVNGVPVIKSGTDFRNLSRITVQPREAGDDGKKGTRLRIVQEDLIVTAASPVDEDAHELVEGYQRELNKSMEKVLGDLGCAMDATFSHIRTRETNCGNWIADCVKDGMYCLGHDVDIVLLNSGTLRANDVFPPGPFLMRDLVTLLPMLDELCVLSMSGEQVHEAIENGVSQYPKMEGRFPCVSGVRFAFDPRCPIGERVDFGCILVNGEPLERGRQYNVVTKAYLASGKDGYNVFSQCRMVSDAEGTPLLADLVRSQFTHLQTINESRHLPCSAPHSEEKQAKAGAGAASSRRLNHTDLLRRSIHLGLEAHNMSNPPTPPSETPPLSPERFPSPRRGGVLSTLARNGSTEDLEELLIKDPETNWEFGAMGKGDATSCHPSKIGGRYQIFGKTDGRIKCIHPTARKSFDGVGMP